MFVSLSRRLEKLWARASFSFCSVTWTRKRFKHTHFWPAKVQHICKHFASQRKLLRQTEQCFLLPSVTYSGCTFHLQCKVFHNIPNIDFGFHSLSLAIERSFITWSPAPSPEGISFTRAVTTRCFSSGISLGRPRISTLKIKKTLMEIWEGTWWKLDSMKRKAFAWVYNTHIFCWSIFSNWICHWNNSIP